MKNMIREMTKAENLKKYAISAFLSVILFLVVPGSWSLIGKVFVKAIIKKVIMAKIFG